MEASKVYYTTFRTEVGRSVLDKLQSLVLQAGMDDMDFKNKFTAIKIHFGEPGNLAYLRPNYTKAVVDVIKKQGDEAILHDESARRHFIEEACDTLMYLNDIMLCYGVTPEEMETVYHEKHQRNRGRWQERNETDV